MAATARLVLGVSSLTAADGPVAILIVETDQIVSLVTADMLADVGFRTIEVRTASEPV